MLNTQKRKNLENCFSTNNKTNKKKNIIVGLSGGVDSSLSAALLVESGWNVEGLTLWLMKGQGSCCSEGLVDAAGLCEDLGIHHQIIDSREIFEREVIKKTTESYERGFTPLPCSMCNKNVKFEEMLNYALNKKGLHILQLDITQGLKNHLILKFLIARALYLRTSYFSEVLTKTKTKVIFSIVFHKRY